MKPDKLIFSVLAALPKHEVRGKKRLQKLAFLMKEAGVGCDATFRLWDYGPFSFEIAKTADWLTALGKIDERTEQSGALNTFMTIYSMGAERAYECNFLTPHHKELLKSLDTYSTIELEVAATIRYFERQGFSKQRAIQETVEMKPTKTIAPVIQKAEEIIQQLD